jgi:hypothetical protein
MKLDSEHMAIDPALLFNSPRSVETIPTHLQPYVDALKDHPENWPGLLVTIQSAGLAMTASVSRLFEAAAISSGVNDWKSHVPAWEYETEDTSWVGTHEPLRADEELLELTGELHPGVIIPEFVIVPVVDHQSVLTSA